MAKKKVKKEKVEEKKAEPKDEVWGIINKKYGDVVSQATKLLEAPQTIIPVSPMIDEGLSGGIPEGSWVLLSGPEKCGKTTTALQIASHAQLPEFGGRDVYYIDAEGRFKKLNLSSVDNLNPKKFFLVQSQEGNILSAEDNLTIAVDIIKSHPRCVLIIDSASALCHSKSMDEDSLNSDTRSPIPKLMSLFCKTAGTIVPINKTIVIVINHLITNTAGGKGPKFMEDGGKKLQYQGDIRMRCTHISPWSDVEDGEQIGQILHWHVRTSALGPPNRKVDSYIRYGRGIDKLTELIKMSQSLGVIRQKGAWYACEFLRGIEEYKREKDGEPIQFQGQPALYAFINETPGVAELLKEKYEEFIA